MIRGLNAEDVGRRQLLAGFLARCGYADAELSPLINDCSFRRYFRVGGDKAALIMDAPPDHEDVKPFIRISGLLDECGYSVPQVHCADIANGFLLLDDFGDTTYTRALSAGADEHALYQLATDVLIDLHRRDFGVWSADIPAYSDDKLLAEALMFVDWYLGPGLGLKITTQARTDYIDAWNACFPAIRQAPATLVLRDYHVDNLMVLDGRDDLGACGLLDFQDAVIGPASYDVVSLLQDSRRDIDSPLVDAMLLRYFTSMTDTVDQDAFMTSYHALGAQRALKVFGIFTRQSVLYGNHQYLAHIPRLWNHSITDLAAPGLEPVCDWVDCHVPPEWRCTPRPGGGLHA